MATLPTSGPLTLTDIQAVFGGSTNPTLLGNYYRGGGLVPDIAENSNVPTSGQLLLSHFYGATTAPAASNPVIESDELLITAYVGQGFSAQISYTPTYGVVTLAPSSNPLPSTVNLTSTGLVYGESSSAGLIVFTVRVTADGLYSDKTFSIHVVNQGGGGPELPGEGNNLG